MRTLLISLLTLFSIQAIGQDSVNLYVSKRELHEVWPKKLITFKDRVGYNKFRYTFDKKTSKPFMIYTISFLRDTSYRFIYIDNKIKYAEFIFWENPAKKKGNLYRYYLTGSKFLPLEKTKNDLPDLIFIAKKGTELYEQAQKLLFKIE